MNKNDVPNYPMLIEATFVALRALGGSGKNDEINRKAAEILNLSDDILEIMHANTNLTEVDYRLAWARTHLKNYGAISNSKRSVWVIENAFTDIDKVNGSEVFRRRASTPAMSPQPVPTTNINDDDADDTPEEVKTWRTHLHNVLLQMNPYAFERLTQRLLRECGFSEVQVTKKSGDGGIDGTGKLKINGIFTFNIAFQCKRYQGTVGASEIRDFRGSLTTDIEKAVFITTGTFSKPAIEEAATSGKQQIDLMDGEEVLSKLAELQIGVTEVRDYQIDEGYFLNL